MRKRDNNRATFGSSQCFMVAHLAGQKEVRDLAAAKEDTGPRSRTHAYCADADLVNGATLGNGDGDSAGHADATGDIVDQAGELLGCFECYETAGTGGLEPFGD